MADALTIDKDALLMQLLTKHVKDLIRAEIATAVAPAIDKAVEDAAAGLAFVVQRVYEDQSIRVIVTDARKKGL